MVDYKEVVDGERGAKRFLGKLKDFELSSNSFLHNLDYADFARSFLQNSSQYRHVLTNFPGAVLANPKRAVAAHAVLQVMQDKAREIVEDASLLKRIPYKYESAFRKAANEAIQHPGAGAATTKHVVAALREIKLDLTGHDGDGGFTNALSHEIRHLKPHMHGYASVREDLFHHAHTYIRKVQSLAELKKKHSEVLDGNKALVEGVVGAVNDYRELLIDGLNVVLPADWSESMRNEFLGMIKPEFSLAK